MNRYWHISIIGFILYFFLYLYVSGFLITAADRPDGLTIFPHWQQLLFRQRSPLLFESIGSLTLGPVTISLSLPNLLLGAILAALVAANIAVSVYSFIALGLRGGQGMLTLAGTIPALLSGAACCAPLLILFLGIQLSAGLLGVFAFLVPVAIILLLASLLWSLSRIRSGKF